MPVITDNKKTINSVTTSLQDSSNIKLPTGFTITDKPFDSPVIKYDTLSSTKYDALIKAAAQKYGVPYSIGHNLFKTESNFNPNAKSKAGALGIAQFMPNTAKELGVNPLDPNSAIPGAMKYLRQQYDKSKKWDLAVAAYNAGPGNVKKYGGVPPFKETQAYTKKVMKDYKPDGEPSNYVERISGNGSYKKEIQPTTLKTQQSGIHLPKNFTIIPGKEWKRQSQKNLGDKWVDLTENLFGETGGRLAQQFGAGLTFNYSPTDLIRPDASMVKKIGYGAANLAGMAVGMLPISKALEVTGLVLDASGMVPEVVSKLMGSSKVISYGVKAGGEGASYGVLEKVNPNNPEASRLKNAMHLGGTMAMFGSGGGLLEEAAAKLSPTIGKIFQKVEKQQPLTKSEIKTFKAFQAGNAIALGAGAGATQPADSPEEFIQHIIEGAGTFGLVHGITGAYGRTKNALLTRKKGKPQIPNVESANNNIDLGNANPTVVRVQQAEDIIRNLETLKATGKWNDSKEKYLKAMEVAHADLIKTPEYQKFNKDQKKQEIDLLEKKKTNLEQTAKVSKIAKKNLDDVTKQINILKFNNFIVDQQANLLSENIAKENRNIDQLKYQRETDQERQAYQEKINQQQTIQKLKEEYQTKLLKQNQKPKQKGEQPKKIKNPDQIRKEADTFENFLYGAIGDRTIEDIKQSTKNIERQFQEAKDALPQPKQTDVKALLDEYHKQQAEKKDINKKQIKGIAPTALQSFPEMQQTEGGGLALNGFTPYEIESLKANGAVYKNKIGVTVVDEEKLWKARKDFQSLPRQEQEQLLKESKDAMFHQPEETISGNTGVKGKAKKAIEKNKPVETIAPVGEEGYSTWYDTKEEAKAALDSMKANGINANHVGGAYNHDVNDLRYKVYRSKKEINKLNKEYRAKIAAEQKIKDEKAQKEKVKREDLQGFDEGMTPLNRGRVIKTLDRKVRYHESFYTRRELMQKLVKEGNTIDKSGTILGGDNSNGFLTRVGKDILGKTAFDYAEHLIKLRENKAAVHETSLPKEKVKNKFQEMLESGHDFKNIVEARKIASKFYNGKDINKKEVDEAMESAAVGIARKISRDFSNREYNPEKVFDKLVDLQNRMPNLSTRTSTSIRDQAYSTPLPLAYISSLLADIKDRDYVYEPSAGNGALLIRANADRTTANEINPDRIESLKKLGFKNIKNEDGTALQEKNKDVVIANPPFGTVKDKEGKSKEWSIPIKAKKGEENASIFKTTQIDQAMAFRALNALKDDGRAVLIVGSVNGRQKSENARKIAYRAKSKVKFFKTLYDNYNVVDVFTVSGDLYKKQGAAWPVDIITIDGRGKSDMILPGAKPPDVISTVEQLKEKIDESKNLSLGSKKSGRFTETSSSGSRTEGESSKRGPIPNVTNKENTGYVEQPNRGEKGKIEQVRKPAGESRHGIPAEGIPVSKESSNRSTGINREQPNNGGRTEPNGNIRQPAKQEINTERQGSSTDTGRRLSGTLGGKPNYSIVEELKNASEADIDKLLDDAFGKDVNVPKNISEELQNASEKDIDNLLDETFSNKQTNKEKTSFTEKITNDEAVKKWADEHKGLESAKNTEEITTKGLIKKGSLESLSGVKNAIKGLSAIFTPKNTLSSGFIFNEDTYKAAKPHFKAAWEDAKNAGHTLKQLVQHLASQFGAEIRPYLKKFFIEQQKKEQTTTQTKEQPILQLKNQNKIPPKAPEGSENQTPYKPISKSSSMEMLTPVNMAEVTHKSLENLQKKHGPIDEYVAKKLGYSTEEILGKNGEYGHFSSEQIDAIGLAIDAVDKKSGFIIGDQTGAGKGRVVAAMIRYADKKGITPIFVTEKPNLYTDMYRDLSDIGMSDMDKKILITNANLELSLTEDGSKTLRTKANHNQLLKKIVDTGEIPSNYKVIFTTYDQMKQAVSVRRDLLKKLAPNSMLIMDEAHNAGGTAGAKIKGGKYPRSIFFRELVNEAHSVFYSSATYAKRPDIMDLYRATDMALAVEDISDLGDAIAAGGVPLQQVTAAMLSEAGQYIRREKSFAGINYNLKKIPIDKKTINDIAPILSGIKKFSDKYIDSALKDAGDTGAFNGTNIYGGEAASEKTISSVGFASVMHNLIGQSLLALKTQGAVDEAISAFKERGQKPVITLSNTMGSFIKNYAEEHNLNPGDGIALSFNDLFFNYLNKTRSYVETDVLNNKTRHYLTDKELGEEAVTEFNKVKKAIYAMDLKGLPISPIDYIKNKLEKAGIRSSELTGRDDIIEYLPDGHKIYNKRGTKEKNISSRTQTIYDFNTDKIDALILNRSGSTGLSLHAVPKFEGQIPKPRHMIILQPEANIDTHMQILGRINRAGQVVLPSYSQLVGDTPAEMRPAAILAKKLASLNANTTADTKSDVTAKGVVNFINKYGDKVVAGIMADMPELHKALGKPLPQAEDGFEVKDAAAKVTGRIPMLLNKQQENLYSLIENEYKSLIEQLDATGENDLEAKTYKTDAITLDKTEACPASGESPFQSATIMNKVDMKKIGRAYDGKKVKALIKKAVPDIAEDKSFQKVIEKGQRDTTTFYEKEKQKFNEYSREIIDNIPDEQRRTAQEERLDVNRTSFNMVSSDINIGNKIFLNTDDKRTLATITKVKRDGDPKNPLALGTWKATLAIADGRGSITYSFAQLRKNSDWESYGTLSEKDLKTFDEASKTTRENRFIATGNLLSSYSAFKTGRIINFTDDKNVVKQGILMPVKFDYNQAAENRPLIITDPQQVKTLLDNDLLLSTKGGLRLLLGKQGNNKYRIIVPASKAKGSRYYLNTHLLSVLGKDFVKSGKWMGVDIDSPQKLKQIVSVITKDMSETLRNVAEASKARRILGIKVNKLGEGDNSNSNQLYSKTSSDRGYPLSMDTELETYIDNKLLTPRGRKNLKIDVLQSPEERETGIEMSSIYSDDGNTVIGKYDPKTGRITLYADNISLDKAKGIITHEVIHQAKDEGGWGAVFGKKSDLVLNQIKRNIADKKDAWVTAENKARDAGTPNKDLFEETITYFMQDKTNAHTSVFQRIKRAIQGFLFRHGIRTKVTDDVIHNLADRMIKAKAKGGAKGGLYNSGVKFSKKGNNVKGWLKTRIKDLKDLVNTQREKLTSFEKYNKEHYYDSTVEKRGRGFTALKDLNLNPEDIKIKPNWGKTGTINLEDVIDAKAFFDKFPELKNIKVKVVEDESRNALVRTEKGKSYIQIGAKRADLTDTERLNTIFRHELSHLIDQKKNGINAAAWGSTPDAPVESTRIMLRQNEQKLSELEMFHTLPEELEKISKDLKAGKTINIDNFPADTPNNMLDEISMESTVDWKIKGKAAANYIDNEIKNLKIKRNDLFQKEKLRQQKLQNKGLKYSKTQREPEVKTKHDEEILQNEDDVFTKAKDFLAGNKKFFGEKALKEKKDISSIEHLIGSTMFNAKKAGGAYKRLYDNVLRKVADNKLLKQNELRNEGDYSLFQPSVNLKKDHPALYQRIMKYIVKQDINAHGYNVKKNEKGTYDIVDPEGKPVSEAQVSFDKAWRTAFNLEADNLKFSDKEKEVLLNHRKMTLKLYHHYTNTIEDIIRQHELANVEVPKITIIQNGKPVKIDLKAAMQEMGKRIGYYFPRIRKSGGWRVDASKSGLSDQLKFFQTKFGARQYKQRMIRLGYKAEVTQSGSLSEDLFQSLSPLLAQEQVINKTLEKMQTGDDFDATMADLFVKQYAAVLKSHGSRARMIGRSDAVGAAVKRGYETDLVNAMAAATDAAAGGYAKQIAAINGLKTITGRDIPYNEYLKKNPDANYVDYQKFTHKRGIDASRQKNIYSEATASLKDVLKNNEFSDNVIASLKSAAVVKYLGFRVASAAVNVTNMAMAAPAALAGELKIPMRKAFSAIGSAGKNYFLFRVGKSTIMAPLFEEIERRGFDTPQFNREAVEALESKAGGAYRKLIDASMYMFGVTERINRATTVSANYMAIAQKEGKSLFPNGRVNSEWLEKARDISDLAHGAYGKENRLHLARGNNIGAQALQTYSVFMTFTHTYLQEMARLGLVKKQWGPALYMALSGGIFGGIGATVPVAVAKAIAKLFNQDDPEEAMIKAMGNSDFVRYGIPAIAGVSLKGSLSTRFELPTKTLDLFGAPGSVVSDEFQGLKNISKGYYREGLEKMLPTGLGSVSKALREKNQGVTTKTGSKVFFGNKQIKANDWDTFMRFFSFSPTNIDKKRTILYNEYKKKQRYNEYKADFNKRFKEFYFKPPADRNKNDLINLYADIRDFNKELKQKHLLRIVSPVTFKSLRSSFKRANKPRKSERLRK